MNRLVLLLVPVALLLLAACAPTEGPPGASARTASRKDFGAAWPLTVEEGTLACEEVAGDIVAVTFTADGTTYAVNGTAANDYPLIDPIWADDPRGIAPKADIGPLLDAGFELCGQERLPGATAQTAAPTTGSGTPEPEPLWLPSSDAVRALPQVLIRPLTPVGVSGVRTEMSEDGLLVRFRAHESACRLVLRSKDGELLAKGWTVHSLMDEANQVPVLIPTTPNVVGDLSITCVQIEE